MTSNSTRKCGHCAAMLPLHAFYSDRRTSDGLRSWCKECCSRSSAAYNLALKEERNEKRKKYKEQYYSDPENWNAKLEADRERYHSEDAAARDQRLKSIRIWRAKNRRKRKHKELQQFYGIGIDEYEAKIKKQKGLCALCRRIPGKKGLAVDHDHKTKVVRDLLCGRCNTAIGLFFDDPALLRRAITYLKKHQSIKGDLA